MRAGDGLAAAAVAGGLARARAGAAARLAEADAGALNAQTRCTAEIQSMQVPRPTQREHLTLPDLSARIE
eukprot:COSAG04_NODE_23508_length_337_cov_0.806723_1_plen_69_part_01